MKTLATAILLLVPVLFFGQQDAWIYFTGKPDAQTYIQNPLQMLSQRAIDRRATQGIPLDSKDVPVHQPYIDQIAATPGIEVKAKSKWLNSIHVRGSVDAITNLQLLSFVESVVFADRSLNNSQDKTTARKAKRTSSAVGQLPYGNSANQVEMLNGHLLHQQNYTGSGKIIAVMDAGFPGVDSQVPFQRLRDDNKILGGYNFVDRNTEIYTRGSHGTSVLSTMGGYVADQLVGTAPDASYYLFITEDVNSENPVEESYWVEAAEMADSLGVDVINTSLGYFTYDNPAYSYTYEDLNGTTAYSSKGANVAFSRGMIVVVSAGNSGSTPNPHVSVPADATFALAIGAVTATGTYATFSSIGPSSDGRIKPDIAAKGQSATVANASGNISLASGTSFASPIMAGMIASLWQAIPDMTNLQLMQIVKQSAHLYSNPNIYLGYGIPNFATALEMAMTVAENESDTFIVHPNPVDNVFQITTNASVEKATISIFDSLGKRVIEQKLRLGETSIDVESLTSGLYFYRINSAKGGKTGKILKN